MNNAWILLSGLWQCERAHACFNTLVCGSMFYSGCQDSNLNCPPQPHILSTCSAAGGILLGEAEELLGGRAGWWTVSTGGL